LIIVLLTIFGLNENNTGRSTNYDLTMSGQSGIDPTAANIELNWRVVQLQATSVWCPLNQLCRLIDKRRNWCTKSLVSRPRNQRYLHPRGIPSGVFILVVLAKRKQGRQFTVEFNLKNAIFGNKADRFD